VPVDHSELLTPAQVIALTGISEPTRRRYVALGRFPPPIPTGPRDVAWLRTAVQAWIAENGQRPAASRPGPAAYRLARRFKRKSDAESLASFVRALGPVVAQGADGLWTVTVTTPKASAFERFVKHTTPYETWERVDAEGGTP
jgi:prophage regulatory protein